MENAASLIDQVVYQRQIPEAIAKIKTPDGVDLVVYNPNTSALMAFHTASLSHGTGFESHQLNAGLRLEADHLAGQMGSSNAAAIAKHLERSLKATAEDARKKAFGHVMRPAPESKSHIDVAAIKMDAAYKKGWIKKRMAPMSWTLLDLLIIHDLSMKQISVKLGLDQRYLGLRVREALSELAVLYDTFDATGGRDDEHPSYRASKG